MTAALATTVRSGFSPYPESIPKVSDAAQDPNLRSCQSAFLCITRSLNAAQLAESWSPSSVKMAFRARYACAANGYSAFPSRIRDLFDEPGRAKLLSSRLMG